MSNASRMIFVGLCVASLGCAPPPVIGGNDGDGSGSANDDASGDGVDGTGQVDGTATETAGCGDLDPAQLDRTQAEGTCGYPGPGSVGYGTEVGQRIANNTTALLETCDGTQVQLADYMCAREDCTNNRAILINIGAGWCLPCQEETLEFPELYDEYHDQGFELLQVMFQDWESLAPTSGFCEEWQSGEWADGSLTLEFPVIIDQVFDWGSIYLQDPQSATPVNMLIDANGHIRWKLTGQKPPLEVLRAQIELVLQQPYEPPS